MHIYRFNITLDIADDFFFELDIKPSQTFLEFHNSIVEVLELSGTELASFYISNDLWKKKTEITLIDMNVKDDDFDFDEEKPKRKKILLMDKTKLIDIIEDPHQRFLYIYDFLSPITLYIEMIKILEANPQDTYPLCSKTSGELPTKKNNISITPNLSDDVLVNETEGLGFFSEDEEAFDDEDNDLNEFKPEEEEGLEDI